MPQRSPVIAGVDQTAAGYSDCVTTDGVCGSLSSVVLQGLRSEFAAVWFDRGVYERAESHYVRLQDCQNGTTAPANSRNNPENCYHGNQEACHHVVQTVWVNKHIFDQAESHLVAQCPNQPNVMTTPSSLRLLPTSYSSSTLCDEGYLSQTPTPATPASRSVNGLPFPPALLHGVWLEKPLYDRAEAAFCQTLYVQTEPNSRPAKINEDQGGLQDVSVIAPKKTKPDRELQQKHHNYGVKEEVRTWCHLLHADSEKVWLDCSRYVEAETRYYEAIAAKSSNAHLKYDSVLK